MRAPAPSHTRSSERGKASDAVRWAAAIIAVATLCRLAVGALLPIGVDEAYAVGIARQFSLSYYDHPPLHFWLVGAWAKLWDNEALLLLRLPFIALSALSSWLMFRLGSRMFGAAAGLWAVGLFSVAPVFGLAHGTLILPDGPLLCASLAMVLVLAQLLFDDETGGRQLWRWALVGALAGLTMLAKYHGLLLVGGTLFYLLTTRHRSWLARPGPWLAAAIAAVMFLPVLIWNGEHGWVSFAFQAGRGRWGGSPELAGALTSLLAQSLYLVPWLAVPLAVALLRGLFGGPGNERRWLLVSVALPPILLFTVAATLGRGLPHWQMPGWLFTLPLLGEMLAGLSPLFRRVAVSVAVVTAVAVASLVGSALAQARWGSFDEFTRAHFRSDPTDMLQPWDALREQLTSRGLPKDDRTFIAAFNWIRAAELNAVFGKSVPVLCLCGDARHFAFLHPPAEFAGWSAILIDVPDAIANDAALAPTFASLGAVEDVSLTKAGRVAVPLSLRIGSGFHP